MRTQHIGALMVYERELFGPEAWTPGGYRDELRDTKHRHYVVDIDEAGALRGWAGVRVLDDEAEVLTVGVIPAAQGQGIGTALLTELVDEATRRGARAIFLEVRVDNEAARHLYLREKFIEVGIRRGYYENGRVDAVVMRRDV